MLLRIREGGQTLADPYRLAARPFYAQIQPSSREQYGYEGEPSHLVRR